MIKEVKKIIEELKINVVYLPTYSPDFNPIEKMWFKIKSILRKLKVRVLENLPDAIKYSFSKVCESDCLGCIIHVLFISNLLDCYKYLPVTSSVPISI